MLSAIRHLLARQTVEWIDRNGGKNPSVMYVPYAVFDALVKELEFECRNMGRDVLYHPDGGVLFMGLPCRASGELHFATFEP
jgi:hypothetical protein